MPPQLSDGTWPLILPDGSIPWPPVVTGASGSAAEAGAALAEAPLVDASTSSTSPPVAEASSASPPVGASQAEKFYVVSVGSRVGIYTDA